MIIQDIQLLFLLVISVYCLFNVHVGEKDPEEKRTIK